MIFLPHTNTVILLEPYCGTITEPGLPVVTLHGTHETGPGSKPFVGEKTTSRTQRRRRLEKPPLKQLLVPYSFNHECRNTFSFKRHKFLSQNVQKQLSSPVCSRADKGWAVKRARPSKKV